MVGLTRKGIAFMAGVAYQAASVLYSPGAEAADSRPTDNAELYAQIAQKMALVEEKLMANAQIKDTSAAGGSFIIQDPRTGVFLRLCKFSDGRRFFLYTRGATPQKNGVMVNDWGKPGLRTDDDADYVEVTYDRSTGRQPKGFPIDRQNGPALRKLNQGFLESLDKLLGSGVLEGTSAAEEVTF